MEALQPPVEKKRDLLTAYYLATPLFILGDYAFSLPVRVALEDPLHRGAYYAVLFGLGLLSRAQPMVSPWVGMLESATNIFLLILAILLPIWSMPDAIMAGTELVGPFDRISLATVLLSSTALVISFHRYQRAARPARTPGARTPWRLG